ncbi:hypothetical protein F5880DRAFT_1512679, partial [Lentinula raphanica]
MNGDSQYSGNDSPPSLHSGNDSLPSHSLLSGNNSVPSVEAVNMQEHPASPTDMQEPGNPASPAATDAVWGAPHTGWGYRDGNGWGRWGTTPVNEPTRECHISNSPALRNLRVDFNIADLSFESRHNRDPALDHVDTKVWASVQ